MIWLEVTPWSVLPVALPPWQTFVRLPKLAAAVADCDDDADDADDDDAEVVGGVLLDPARLQPPAITTVTATAAAVLIESLTRFLLDDVPGSLAG
jgi:hypothetical protein